MPAVTPLVGAIDQGTSSSRFFVFDSSGAVVASAQEEFPQIYPRAGWVEHDPEAIWTSVQNVIQKATDDLVKNGYSVKDIKAVGITNQRETTVVWNKTTGQPLHNAIVWMDARGEAVAKALAARTPSASPAHFQPRCGLPFSTYFSAVKLRWLLDNSDAVASAHESGHLAFGTVDSWLAYALTGRCAPGAVHVTDVTNASRTMLLNLESLQWDDVMLEFFGIRRDCLPDVRSSSEIYGYIADGPLAGIPIAGILGDQQAALVGQRCFAKGDVKNTYGTGCFMLLNTGLRPSFSHNGLLTTVAYKFGDRPAAYALEGSVAIGGAAVKFLRDNLGLIKQSSDINALAASVPDTGGVYFVPAFTGLLAPRWRPDARGAIVGLTQFSTGAHLARATLEAVAWQTREVVDAMAADAADADDDKAAAADAASSNNSCRRSLAAIRVDGGLARSDLAMQIQADAAGTRVVRPAFLETTVLGAALAAGLAAGVWDDLDAVTSGAGDSGSGAAVFVPNVGDDEREARFAKWQRAVEKSLDWAID